MGNYEPTCLHLGGRALGRGRDAEAWSRQANGVALPERAGRGVRLFFPRRCRDQSVAHFMAAVPGEFGVLGELGTGSQ